MPMAGIKDLSSRQPCAASARESTSKLRIPTEAGRVFRGEAGQRSDLKPATIPN
jgi:hypothetical protein